MVTTAARLGFDEDQPRIDYGSCALEIQDSEPIFAGGIMQGNLILNLQRDFKASKI
jgi:hypothetical protein